MNRYLGERFGYLRYHAAVFDQLVDDVDAEIEEIRSSSASDEEKIRRQYQALRQFKREVRERSRKLDDQVSGVSSHLDEETIEHSDEVFDSAWRTYREEPDDHTDGFVSASEVDDDATQ